MSLLQVSGKQKEKSGMSLVDLAYRRAKAVKAKKKAVDAGKILIKTSKKSKPRTSQRSQSRTEEMKELFESDMSERKRKTNSSGAGKKSKHSFKSKSRYMKHISV